MVGRLLFYQITANITPAATVASLSFRFDFWLKNHHFYPWDVSFSGGGTTSELALVAQAWPVHERLILRGSKQLEILHWKIQLFQTTREESGSP